MQNYSRAFRVTIDHGTDLLVCGDSETTTSDIRAHFKRAGIAYRSVEPVELRIPHYSRVDSPEAVALWLRRQYR